MKKLIIFLFLLLSSHVFAQLDYSWGTALSISDIAQAKMFIDPNGYTYVPGNYSFELAGEWSGDLVVKKFGHSGPISTYTYDNNNGYEKGRDIVTDGSGIVYALGLTTVDGINDDFKMLIVKFNGSGVALAHQIILERQMEATSMAMDNSGNVYVLGSYNEAVTFIRKGMLIKLNSSLDIIWTRTFSSAPDAYANLTFVTQDLKISGNSLCLNYRYSNDDGLFTRLLKYDLSGNLIWDKNLGESFLSSKIEFDNNGNIYSAGYATPFHVFRFATLIKYNSSGDLQSYRQLDSSTSYCDMKIDEDNSIYLVANDPWYKTTIAVKYNDSPNPTWIKYYDDGSDGGGEGAVLTLTNNSVIFAVYRFYYSPSIHYATFTFLCEKTYGEDLMLNRNTSNPFQAPYAISADKNGNCYLLDILNGGWFIYCLHYPVTVVSQLISTPGLYIFTSQGTLASTSTANTIATLNINSITGTGKINVGFNFVEPINPTFAGITPANVSPYSWTITKSDTITSINAEIRFDYTQIFNNGGITDPYDVTIWQRSVSGAGDFSELPTTLVGTELRATVTSFGEFIFASPGPLPVELSSFNSLVSNNSVELNWTTNSEINNKGFQLERKSGNTQYASIGFVNGNGTSSQSHTYSFKDNDLAKGSYHYRLKQTDYNGNYKYFELNSEILVGIPLKFSLSQNYPNPFNPSTKINYALPVYSKVSLKIYDMTGREVASLVNTTQTAGYYVVQFNASNMASGIYFYNLVAEGGEKNFVMTKKMVLVR